MVKPVKKEGWKTKTSSGASAAAASVTRKPQGGNDKKRKERDTFGPAPEYPCRS